MQGYGDLPEQPSSFKDVMAEMDPLDVDGLLSKCDSHVLIYTVISWGKWRFNWTFMVQNT
jgi:hypothetical protein